MDKLNIPTSISPYGKAQGTLGFLVPAIAPSTGHATTWTHCREVFHQKCKFGEDIMYCCGRDREELIESFVGLIEHNFSAPRSKVFRSQYPGIVWIKVSSWWRENHMRYRFLTIALRASNSWGRGLDWRNAILSCQYANSDVSRKALRYFMDGFTEYNGYEDGWCRVFSKRKNLRYLLKAEPYNVKQEKLHKLAYEQWEREGRTFGRAEEHWKQALLRYNSERTWRQNGEIVTALDEDNRLIGRAMNPGDAFVHLSFLMMIGVIAVIAFLVGSGTVKF